MKPKDLAIGVVDLFAVLLPGAILTFLVASLLACVPREAGIWNVLALEGTARWVAFLVASYLLGHLLFSESAHLDTLYDRLNAARSDRALLAMAKGVRDARLGAIKTRLGVPVEDATRDAATLRLWVWLVSWLAVRTWPPAHDRKKTSVAHETAAPPAASAAPGTSTMTPAINAFKAAVALLSLTHPAQLGEVRRLEADSKFFRSSVLLLLVVALVLAARSVWMAAQAMREPAIVDTIAAVACFVLLRFSFARYCEQRAKAVDLAYQLVVLAGDAMLAETVTPTKPDAAG